MRRLISIVCVIALSVMAVAAQQPQSAPPPPSAAPPAAPAGATAQGAQGQQPIRVNTKLVVEEVTVKDKSGKPIEGLTANDFVLTEDGVAQTISFAEYPRLQVAAASAEPA